MKNLTVKELIARFNGHLIKSELLQIYCFFDNYSTSDMIIDVESVLNREIISYDIWSKEEFIDMFCSPMERMFIESKFFKETRFLTIKVKVGDNDE